MLSHLIDPVLSWRGFSVYLLVGALVFSEAAIMVGFVFPGETAVILGGVIASEGHISLPWLVVVVVVCAIVGDSVGYFVGERLGPRLLTLPLLRHRRRAIEHALQFLGRRGAVAVFVGRFTAFLRAVVPGLAGMSAMRYPTFLVANAAGGVVWGTTFALLGYFVGSAYRRLESESTVVSLVFLALLIGGYVFLIVRSRRKERAEESGGDPDDGNLAGSGDDPGV